MAELPDKAARTVLCGGRSVMGVPTAIHAPFRETARCNDQLLIGNLTVQWPARTLRQLPMAWLVDGRSNVWSVSVEAAQLFSPSGGSDPVLQAVMELGFIHLEPDAGTITVTLNATRTAPITLAGAIYIIADQNPMRTIILDGSIEGTIAVSYTVIEACRMLENMIQRASTENADLLPSGIAPSEVFTEQNQLSRAAIALQPGLG